MTEAWAGDDPDFDAEPFAAEDLIMVGRWQRKMLRIDAEIAEIDAVVAAEKARIDAVHLRECERLSKQYAWLERSCVQFHEAVLRRDPKRLTIVGPNGTLKARAQRPEWRWEDEQGFVVWARERHPETLLRQPPVPGLAPDKAAAKTLLVIPKGEPGDVVLAFSKDGEQVPGVTVLYRPRKHEVVVGHTDPMDGRTDAGDEPE